MRANIIIQSDPDKMVAAYRRAWAYEDEMRRATRERVSIESKALVLKYPSLLDFDILGTRHFIPYESARLDESDDEIVGRYLDIGKFLSLSALKGETPRSAVFGEAEERLLGERIQAHKDKLLRARIVTAMTNYRSYEKAFDDSDKPGEFSMSFEDAEAEVFRNTNSSTPEIEYLVHFKKTGECAKYSFYVFDDGRISESFYKTNDRFNDERPLLTR
jgi:hypothetical protein